MKTSVYCTSPQVYKLYPGVFIKILRPASSIGMAVPGPSVFGPINPSLAVSCTGKLKLLSNTPFFHASSGFQRDLSCHSRPSIFEHNLEGDGRSYLRERLVGVFKPNKINSANEYKSGALNLERVPSDVQRTFPSQIKADADSNPQASKYHEELFDWFIISPKSLLGLVLIVIAMPFCCARALRPDGSFWWAMVGFFLVHVGGWLIGLFSI